MLFSENTLHRAWALATGRCECPGDNAHHGRCDAALLFSKHGYLADGGWFARAWTPLEQGGPDTPENVEALCGTCYARLLREGAAFPQALPVPVN